MLHCTGSYIQYHVIIYSGKQCKKSTQMASQVARVVKNPPANAGDRRDLGSIFSPGVRKVPWSRAWQPTLVLSPAESHRQWDLVSYSPRGGKKWDTTEMMSCISTHTHSHTTHTHRPHTPKPTLTHTHTHAQTHTHTHTHTNTHTHPT